MKQFLCDNCKADLSETSNSIDYRLALINERIPCKSGAVTDMMFYPVLKKDTHFCGLVCLATWIDKRI